MSAEPERDQIDIWNKLNNLYGEEGERVRDVSDEDNDLSVDDSETKEESLIEDNLKADKFSQDHKNDNLIQKSGKIRTQSNSMGVERLNETCARCKKTCKQNTKKLNRMLCIGFEPLDPEEV